MSLLDDPEDLRANIDIMRTILPIVDDIDRPYYEQRLQEMCDLLEKHHRETLESESPLSYEGQSRPITPPVVPSSTLKRNLEATNLPESKRSRQPSPNNAVPFLNQWSQSLPRRQSHPVQQSTQAFIDLTQSDPPTPVRSPQLRAFDQTAQGQTYLDPFQELQNAFTGELANGHSVLNNNLNMNYMSEAELAAFMDPNPPGGGFGYQPQPYSFSDLAAATNIVAPPSWGGLGIPRRPGFWGGLDSDADDYGSPYIPPAEEAQAIEKLLENFKGDGEKAEERAPTPAIMTCTLKEYQRIGLSWLLKMERGNSKGGILADDMGLGKTVSNLDLVPFSMLMTAAWST